jgi:PAS domain S-box-containing protein
MTSASPHESPPSAQPPLLTRLVGLIMSLFSLIVFLIDSLLDVDFVIGLFYVLVVVFSILICPHRKLILGLALLCTVLLLLGAGHPLEYAAQWKDTLMRLSSLLVIWMSVWLGLAQLDIQASNSMLEERFRKVFNAAPTGLILIDSQGRVILANPQASTLFSAPGKSLMGLSIEELIPIGFSHSEPSTEPKVSRDLWGRRRDGTKFPVEIGLSPIALSRGHCTLASVMDVTDRKHLEKIKDEFAGMVSHEIRTPLATISAIVDNLSDEIEGELSTDQMELVRLARSNIGRLNHIIDSLSHYIRFEMGLEEVQLQTLDLKTLVSESIVNYAMLTEDAGKQLITDVSDHLPRVTGNMTLVTQILNNMFSNALKHAESRIRISIASARPDELPEALASTRMLRVSVGNDGMGVPRAVQDKIFEKFYRMERHSVSPSLGLGLYLCKKMVEAQKGHISLESEDGWTIFNVYLKCA